MKPLFFRSILLLSYAILPEFLYAQTDILGGEVSGMWTSSGSPYRIFDHILIPDDSTLTVEPGVSIIFQGHFRMNVQGNIVAKGSPSDSIYFTIKDTTGFVYPMIPNGGWGGIRIIDTDIENDSSIFEYCNFRFGKAVASYWHDNAGGALCVVQFDKVRVANSLFAWNSAGGPEVPSGGAIHLAWSDIKVMHCRFENNIADSACKFCAHKIAGIWD